MRLCTIPAVLAVLVFGCAGAACTTTVDGTGSVPSARSRVGSAPPSAPASVPSASVPLSPTSSLATPSTGSSTPVTALDCPTGAVTSRSAPFCYPLPAGFTDYSTQSGYGTGWTYRTLVSVDVHDLIEVLASRYQDTTSLTDAQLQARFDADMRLKVGAYDVVRAGPVTPARVAGGRAFRQLATYANGVDTDVTTVYLGRTIATIQCQSQAHAEQVRAACATVRTSIRIVSA